MAGEFDLIRRYLRPLAEADPAALELTDDAAILVPPSGEYLVAAADAMVAGVHFLPEDPPDTVGRKLLRVNLSDLAAMGARPLAYLTTLALPPQGAEAWLAGFATGLGADQATFGLSLIGGDMTRTDGPLTVSLTILGALPAGQALRRGGAQSGDALFVSGSIGDAALGLRVLQGRLAVDPAAGAALVERYCLPQPRLALGRTLLAEGLARAAIDVSDGLLADAGHIAEASGLAIRIEAGALPRSPAVAAALDIEPALASGLASGGDDYELLFTAPPAQADALAALGERLAVPITRIGRVETGSGVSLIDAAGQVLPAAAVGWRHF